MIYRTPLTVPPSRQSPRVLAHLQVRGHHVDRGALRARYYRRHDDRRCGGECRGRRLPLSKFSRNSTGRRITITLSLDAPEIISGLSPIFDL